MQGVRTILHLVICVEQKLWKLLVHLRMYNLRRIYNFTSSTFQWKTFNKSLLKLVIEELKLLYYS